MRYRVYIAGPVTLGDHYNNLGQAVRLQCELMRLGYSTLNPMLTMGIPEKFSWSVWMDCCLPWVEAADILYRLPGKSRGADVEVEHAKKHGVTVVFSVTELQTAVATHEAAARKGIPA